MLRASNHSSKAAGKPGKPPLPANIRRLYNRYPIRNRNTQNGFVKSCLPFICCFAFLCSVCDVELEITSRMRDAGLACGDVGRMVKALSILPGPLRGEAKRLL